MNQKISEGPYPDKSARKKRGDVFNAYYTRWQQAFVQALTEKRQEQSMEMPELSSELLENFTEQMRRITLRTLLFEMEISEEAGELTGDTDEEKYACFADAWLTNTKYLYELYKTYPVMYGNVMHYMENSVNNIWEVLERFDRDKDEINQRFWPNLSCTEIRCLEGCCSDPHRGGRQVYIIRMDNGERLVYKPRSLAVDSVYQNLLSWLFDGLGISSWQNRIWDRGEYGWSQWVSQRTCTSQEELLRYYRRMGILLCVSYLLGSEDMHYENLIACGEYPVIIDLETAVGSGGTGPLSEQSAIRQTEAEKKYQESVLHTGLLPLCV